MILSNFEYGKFIHKSNPKDLSLLQELAFKMGFESQILKDSDKED